MPDAKVIPVMNSGVRKLCYKPYPGHPKGCPNFGKKAGCPPRAPMIYDTLDLDKDVWAIWNVFDLAAHVARMLAKHPQWSDRQLKCCLYWQPTARKALKEHIRVFRLWYAYAQVHVVACPEAQGVDLTATMHNAGIDLEWPPENVTYQIVLVGTRKEKA